MARARSESELSEMRDYYRQSRNALPGNGAIGLAATVVGIAVHMGRDGGLPWWVWGLLIVVAWYGFVGDLINVVYLRRRIGAVERDAKDENAH